MKDYSIQNLFFDFEDFKTRYRTLKNTRMLVADSANDFLKNKSRPTFLSNLLFLKDTDFRSILFNNVYIDKISNEIYEIIPPSGERGFFGRKYILHDETGEISCFWATKESKLYSMISCDRFEEMKKFNDPLIKHAFIFHNKQSDEINLAYAEFYGKNKIVKKDLKN